jgi:hypothetical protein
VISGIDVFVFIVAIFDYGIVTAWVKRVAFYKPSRCHITPFKKTVGSKRLFSIGGTAGMKPTVIAQQWTNSKPIQPDQAYSELNHY